MVNKNFNNRLSGVKGNYDCCKGCKERFAGDETKPNCHLTCKIYLEAKEQHEKEKKEYKTKKNAYNVAISATIDGQRRMKTRKKTNQKR